MKKIFTILLAMSALGVILAGCGAKAEEPVTGADATKPAADTTGK